jgi:peptidoglycan/xylan/chitin deacetylase (PgdA/CDA1 family)
MVFSIIIPALNEEDYLEECLKALKSQDFKQAFEIIVVDNGSLDRTIEIASKYADKVISEPKRGIANALKTGCAEAQGQILAFTDADCRVPNFWLSRLFEIFESNKSIVAAGGDYNFYDNGFLPQIIFNKIIAPFISYSYRILFFQKYSSLPNSNLAIRRDAYEKAGGYDPNIKWGQEIDLCKRISRLGKIYFDPNLKVLTSFRRYSGEHTNQLLVFLTAMKESFVTISRFFSITFRGREMAPQKPVRKKTLPAKMKKRGKVVLTFDDGPYGDTTNKILDILKEKNVKATFFLLGKNVEKYPEIIRREMEEGHIIGNHSYNHSRILFLKNSKNIKENIKKAESSIEKASGLRPRFFRPPYGLRSPWMKKFLILQGYILVPLDIMTNDYNIKAKPEKITRYILRHVQPGSIITLHDGRDTKTNYPRKNVIQALPVIIDGIREKGFEIVLLDQLTGEKAYF